MGNGRDHGTLGTSGIKGLSHTAGHMQHSSHPCRLQILATLSMCTTHYTSTIRVLDGYIRNTLNSHSHLLSVNGGRLIEHQL